jgi:HEPN domain-containing protein/predicted nucleotidyltransferase
MTTIMVTKPLVRPDSKPPSPRTVPVSERLLREITRRIVEAFKPDRIILFGSYAYGKPTVQSDVDLLVVMNRLRDRSVFERDRRVAEVVRSADTGGDGMQMDVLVRSPSELAYRLRIGDPFFREVMLKGRVLYSRRGYGRGLDAKKWSNRMPEPVLAAEWVKKAEGDFSVAAHIVRQRKDPQPDLACYRCQQCAGKYLKAYLLQHNAPFERTHDLAKLNVLCGRIDGSFLFIGDWLELLNPYSTEARYPGRVIEMPEAREAVAALRKIRKFVREKMSPK